MKQFSYWEKESFLQPYDLIIVGAGIVGLSSALFYKKAHPAARVLALDKGFIPEGASTRNAGFACIGSIGEHLSDIESGSEEEVKKRIKTRYEGLTLLKETLGEQEIGYEACGGYELFTNDNAFKEAADHISRFNHWMEELIGQKAVYSVRQLNGYDVIRNRLEGALHPGKMMQRLIQRVTDEGVEIKWNCPVKQVNETGLVTVDGGLELTAKKTVISANGFVRQLLPEMNIQPARGFVFVTKPLNELPWKGTFHYDRGYIYFRNIGNRLLAGGARNVDADTETTSDFGTNPVIKKHLTTFADEVLRLDKGWKIDCEWSGIMGFTESKTPVLQRMDAHRVVAAGLSGMGVAIGMAIGEEAAVLLSNK